MAPGGTVEFTRDGVAIVGCSAIPVSNGQATCTAASPTGSHTFRAVYSSTPGYLASQSAKTVLTVS